MTLQPAPAGRSLQSARNLQAVQDVVAGRVEQAFPHAEVTWRYTHVLDGFAVLLPRADVASLARVRGVARVWPNVTYHALREADGVAQIGASQLWGADLATAGQGMKIGVIDDGVDASSPYFNPAGFTYPPGFPKGQTALATPKVIVQRTFAPPTETWKYKNAPFDPVNSFHATHVAGIAAGDHGANAGGTVISGVAPLAQIGNYKALTVPTPDFGLDGNSAEIAAAIDAAVADGMNVLNLSLGEPEVEPSRDLVVAALTNAARAGVVPVVAAGNDFVPFGYGSVSSPGNTPAAITVAAADSRDVIASFSSAGPTPLSLQMKPDVTAPGVSVLSSLPKSQGTWGRLSGTSMATPHVAGAVALLMERHPAWTVDEIKSALEQTGDPVRAGDGGEVPTTREGGGMIDLPRADNPLLFASPTGLSFGELKPGATAARTVTLADAGGGAGEWTASVVVQGGSGRVLVPATATVPGALAVTATAGRATGDVTGFVVLTRGSDTRRIPFWFDVSAPKLGSEHSIAISKPGVYRGTTVGAPARVSEYRYPTGAPGNTLFRGPERVYRLRVTGQPANFGVVVLRGRVEPHITLAGSEDRLAGYTALPYDLNPYRKLYGDPVPAAGVVLPARGTYDLVFDSAGSARGPFSFRLWVNDTKPPTPKIVSTKGAVTVRITDAGSGVDPASIDVQVDGVEPQWRWNGTTLRILAAPGRHHLLLSVADYQETKNMEDVPPILPNTTTLKTTVVVH